MGGKTSRILWAYIFLLPTLVIFVFIVIYPFLYAFWMSLHAWPAFGAKQFIGLENYARMLQDPVFWQSLKVVFIWTLGVVPSIIITSLGLAIALNAKWLRGKSIFRTIYFVPVVTSMVASGFVWRWLFEPTFGVVNYALRSLGLPGPGWLATTTWSLPAVMVVGVWKQIGYAMVIFLAGLQTIPKEFTEAGEIDGASPFQVFRHITMPLLNPTIVFVVVILVIHAFGVFTIPYVMTAGGFTYGVPGGPLNSTRVFVIHIYDLAFRKFNMGYGSANAFVLLLLIMVVTLIQLKVIQRRFEY